MEWQEQEMDKRKKENCEVGMSALEERDEIEDMGE